MPQEVFISYARNASAAEAQALAAKLGELAFLDTDAIDYGDRFPLHLLNGLLNEGSQTRKATRRSSGRPP
jgi:hypothetical protein